MGPLVSTEQHERVLAYIEAGQEGRRLGPDAAATRRGGDGYFVNPTVLVDVKPEMSVMREEIFGPVLVAQRFDDLDEVAKAANDTALRPRRQRSGPRTCRRMHKLAAKLQAPAWSGAIATTVIDPALPFGGYKQSGFGREQAR